MLKKFFFLFVLTIGVSANFNVMADTSTNKDKTEAYISEAVINQAVRELDEGNYDKSLALLNTLDEGLNNSLVNGLITVRDLKTLATFLKTHPDFSIRDFGPLKGDYTFYVSLDGDILACATYKGKAGLLQLNSKGERINHDNIPFAYDYIVPNLHEMLWTEATIFFHVSPYKFKIPFKDTETRALDKSGNECYYSIYSSFAEVIPIPDDYVIDQVDNVSDK